MTNEAGELNLPNGSASDVLTDPADVRRLYAAIPGSGVYGSDDSGQSWQLVSGSGSGAGFPLAGGASSIELTMHNSPGNNVLYAGTLTANASLTSAAAAGDMVLNVSSAAGYLVGDQVRINGNPTRTTLTSIASAGATTLTVASTDGLSGFSHLMVGTGANLQRVTVDTGTPMTATTITITPGLTNPASVMSGVRGTQRLATVRAFDLIANTITIDTNSRLASNQGLGLDYPAGITISNFRDRFAGLFRTINGGTSWTSEPPPTSLDGGSTFGLHPGSQANLHLSMVAHPTNPNVIYLGGDRQPENSSVACGGFPGRIFQGDVSTDTWTQVVCSGANGTAPHADSRAMAILPGSPHAILEADDGGLSVLVTPDAGTLKWQSVNGNLRIGEVFSVGYDSINDIFFGGLQDNGSAEQIASGGLAFTQGLVSNLGGGDIRYTGGDGSTQAADNSNAAQPLRYMLGNNFASFYMRQFDNANNQVDNQANETHGIDMEAYHVRLATPGTPDGRVNFTNSITATSSCCTNKGCRLVSTY